MTEGSQILGDATPSGQAMEPVSQPGILDTSGAAIIAKDAAGRESTSQDETIRKLQSERDKTVAELNKFKQDSGPALELYGAFQQNPEYVPIVEKAIQDFNNPGNAEPKAQPQPNGFNPETDFDAFESQKPGTASYNYRTQQEDARIEAAVTKAVGGLRTDMQTAQDSARAVDTLVASGIFDSREKATGYLSFLQNPTANPQAQQLLMGPLANAFAQAQRGDASNPTGGSVEPSGATQVRETAEAFPTGGIIPGMVAAPVSETDRKFNEIMGSTRTTTILKQ